MSDLKEAVVETSNSSGHEKKPSSSPPDSTIEAPVLSPADERKLLRKIDLHVLPILFVVYVVSFLDR
jgi:hypothetical protein